MNQYLPWYSIFQHLALISAAVFFIWHCKKEKLDLTWKIGLFCFVYFFVLAFLGGRVFSLLETALAENTAMDWQLLKMRAAAGKLRWYGSMLLLLVFSPWFVQFFKANLKWKYFDAFALAVCVYIILVKQGCQVSGDGCYGIPTTLPWGMYYAEGLVPSLIPLHPTPVYDSLFHGLLLIFLLKWRNKTTYPGQTGLLFFGLSSVFCFFLEFVRRNLDAIFGLTLAQLTYSLVLFIALGFWAWRFYKSPISMSFPTAINQKQ